MSSPVWKFFSVAVEDNAFAICKKCSARVPRGGKNSSSFNTSNLISHLRGRHRGEDVLKEYEAAAAAAKVKSAKAKTPSVIVPIQRAFENAKKFSRDSEKAKAINDKVIEFIVLDDQPFSVVEDLGFRGLVQHLEPRYTLPSRRFFSDVSLPALYESVATHIHNLIDKNGLHISFTTDIWTSDVSPVSMLSLTAQWFDEHFNMQKVLLHAQECSGSHTGAMICEAFEAMLERWSITKDRVHVVLRDNARNIIKAMQDCELASLGCMAHTLQLAVNEAVLSQRSITDCISICRKMVGHFKHSQVATSRLQDLQKQLGMKEMRLQQDVPTRWNSTFYMLRSLLDQRRALAAYAVDFQLPAFLSIQQWTLIENMMTILDPCEQLTRDISSSTATVADVIPSIVALKRLLNKTVATDHGVKTSKTTLLQAIEQRFSHIYGEPLFYLATILDPRYKDCYFDQPMKREVTEKLQTMMSCASENVDEPKVKKTKTDGGNVSLLAMYEEILQENYDVTKEMTQSRTEGQINMYLSEPPIPRSESPLEYWKRNKSQFPDLASLARKYLSAPCTSIDSERLFSAAANVMDEKRNRIGCEKAEMLLFIKKNLPLMPNVTNRKDDGH
ncbi:zinc finger BED domain-containing protein 4-like [Misgurnus anguillicaudatus]|uniref:zinc finger BED domain-containing protein 4-like n=1 Tax=Misgurnus anguillicaudatus TaxID=75329 RepID=UPI003CCF4692